MNELHEHIRKLETLSFRALPALSSRLYDGWLLRFSRGYTRRANCVNPLYGSSVDIHDKIDLCEDLFAKAELPAIFKLTPAVQPDNLEEVLLKRGYHEQPTGLTHVFTSSDLSMAERDARVGFSEAYNTGWLGRFADLDGMNEDETAIYAAMLKELYAVHIYASISVGEHRVALGRAVFEDGWVSIFDVVTDPRYRRQGLARTMMRTLLDWGQRQGAERAFLQVEAANTAAFQLYSDLGFQKAYSYRYWSR